MQPHPDDKLHFKAPLPAHLTSDNKLMLKKRSKSPPRRSQVYPYSSMKDKKNSAIPSAALLDMRTGYHAGTDCSAITPEPFQQLLIHVQTLASVVQGLQQAHAAPSEHAATTCPDPPLLSKSMRQTSQPQLAAHRAT